MSDKLDPKELKVLSDILALVLDEQPGQAAAALETVRKRAQRNAITAGALKNLFVAIAPNPPPPRPRATRSRTAGSANATKEAMESRQRIAALTQDLRQLDLDLRTARARSESLQSELHLTRASHARVQSELAAARQTKRPVSMSLVWMACTVGALLGIAGTQLFHSAFDGAPVDKSIYLH